MATADIEERMAALWRRQKCWTWAAQDELSEALDNVDRETADSKLAARAAVWAGRVAACRRVGRRREDSPTLTLRGDGKVSLGNVFRCRHRRFCPAGCAAEESRRREKILAQAVAKADREGLRLQFGTLTLENPSLGGLAAAEAAAWKAFGKLRRQKAWRQAVVGAVAKIETTWTGSHNLHLHVLVALQPQAKADFDWAVVGQAWRALTGAAWTYWKPVDMDTPQGQTRAIHEIAKYTAKAVTTVDGGQDDADAEAVNLVGGGLADMPTPALAEWLAVFGESRKQLWRRYGAWRNLAVDEPEAEDQANSDVEETKAQDVAEAAWDPATGRVFLILPNKDASAPCATAPMAEVLAEDRSWLEAVAAALDAWESRLERREARQREKFEAKKRDLRQKLRELAAREAGQVA